MQWLGLYVASFLLVAGFMRFIGRIAWWKSLLTSVLFALIMFVLCFTPAPIEPMELLKR